MVGSSDCGDTETTTMVDSSDFDFDDELDKEETIRGYAFTQQSMLSNTSRAWEEIIDTAKTWFMCEGDC